MKKGFLMVLVILLLLPVSGEKIMAESGRKENHEEEVLAFPGAEGGGKYASGGRGYDVYEVTTLEDYGEEETPIKGSLRDAVSESNRTIVFRVSGTIHLKQRLRIKQKNLTIAGQTSPGDGITITGYGTDIGGSENIIIRYIRFRPGGVNSHVEFDAFEGRDVKNAIIDHVSASWGIDEALSFYRNENTTVQWSIISESLTISGHAKGRHGYGGIWGGENATFSNNLIASHISRNPALGNTGNSLHPISKADMVNNVIYNWGFNSTYGGDNQKNNVMNDYYKPGPATHEKVLKRIISPGKDGTPSWFHVSGNYMVGNEAVTADNTLGIEEIKTGVSFSDTPFDVLGHQELDIKSAEDAYEQVLNKAGATFPRRDAVDARVVNDVRHGTGRTINHEYEVGGLPELKMEEVPIDRDHDGIPDEWELAHGLDPNNPEDGKEITASGYSNLELYLHSLVDIDYEPQNPDIRLASPRPNSVFKTGDKVNFSVNLNDKKNIKKVEFYQNDQKIGESTSGSFGFDWENAPEGTWYVSAKAIDRDGNETQTTSIAIHINTKNQSGDWKSKDIGKVGIEGNATLTEEGLKVKGAGRIEKDFDSFQFAYQPLEGDGSLTARIDSLTKVSNNAISGLMIREELSADSPTAIISTSVVKADKQDTLYAVHFSTRAKKGENILAPMEYDRPQEKGVPTLPGRDIPYWLKIERKGEILTGYASEDGINWTEVGNIKISMKKKVYIGFAVDAAKDTSQLVNYNTAEFSNISLQHNNVTTATMLSTLEEHEAVLSEKAYRSLTLHLTAIGEFEEKAAGEKVINHMESFKKLLDYQLKDNSLSQELYEVLKADANSLIQKWEGNI